MATSTPTMGLAAICRIVALVLFAIGSSSRWWGPSPQPYYPTIVSLGLFFLTLSFVL